MDLDRLIEFNIIAELGSFTKAADRLGISTAVLSARFSKFESLIGQKLLDRSSRTVILTDVGQRFIADSKEIINDYQLAVKRGKNSINNSHTELAIALSAFGFPRRLRELLTELDSKYINLKTSIIDECPLSAWQELIDGHINMFIGGDVEPNSPRIEKNYFGYMKQYVIVPDSHPFSRKITLNIDELTSEKLLLYPVSTVPGIREKQVDMLINSNIHYTLVDSKISKNFTFDYISMGFGIGLLPFFSRPGNLPYGLRSVLLDNPAAKLDSYIYFLRDTDNALVDAIVSRTEHRKPTMDDYG